MQNLYDSWSVPRSTAIPHMDSFFLSRRVLLGTP